MASRGQSPLAVLGHELKRAHVAVDLPLLATQLDIPPNLRYLVDGLRRSRRCIELFGDELAECLRAMPGPRLEPVAIIDAIDAVSEWCRAQAWPADDPRTCPMARSGDGAGHPLAGYCLSALFHWPNLFYSLEPADAVPLDTGRRAGGFERFMAEFSMYVLAAQATVDARAYLRFCREWWDNGALPGRSLFSDHVLASRTASASRAARRLSLAEHRELYEHVRDAGDGAPLHARVSAALSHPWGVDDQRLLNALARLIQTVRPGWYRSAESHARRSRQPGSPRAVTRHAKYRDGYIRVVGGAIGRHTVTEDGVAIEQVRPLPASEDDLARELLDTAGAEFDEEDEVVDGGADAANVEPPLSREAAEREAAILMDGAQWFPAEEADDAPGLDTIEVGQPVPGGTVGGPGACTSSWAAEHVRRANYALGLGVNRLTAADARQLLESMRQEPQSAIASPAVVALHASLALGRPLGQITAIEIHGDPPNLASDENHIYYALASRQWLIPSPPPAHAALPLDPDERPRSPWLRLPDQTGFFELLQHVDLARPGRPFQMITASREAAIADLIQRSLPHAAATKTHCADFLFYRLLACSQGDLGIASLVTGHEHSHSRSVRHYANYPAEQVLRSYADAWRFDPNAAETPAPADAGFAALRPTAGYGAKRVPTVAAVQRLLAYLADTASNGAAIPARRNAFTAYTLAGMVLGLAMRPVVDLRFTDFAEVTRAPLLLSFVDKAKSDYDRRINAISEALFRQLQAYGAYRRTLQPLVANVRGNSRFIYFDAACQPERFRPSHFETAAAAVFTLEPYALRRFARTELRARFAVHAEDVDAYMGHWFYGVGPHDRLSTYPMRRLQALAEGAISDLLRDVGFRPIRAPR
ncbi:MAG TPA: hypothetical protein VF292_11730 [Rhodanobacteraceae bacterium]